MVLTTPFHPRLGELNRTGLYEHWAGYLSARRYDMSARHEYFAIRNGVGVFDASPLYKYWVRGPGAERFLAGVLTRDVRRCRPGRAQYTLWCDDAGHVLEDGVVFRHSETEFLLTCARPNLGHLSALCGDRGDYGGHAGQDVEIEDATAGFGLLAVQGPRSRAVLTAIAPGVERLPYFGLIPAEVAGAPVTVSRTGYTGDLGYEILVPARSALEVLDAVLEAGKPHQLVPFGEDALQMVRIEAGLALIGVEFSSSRLAFTARQRTTPTELGLGWMLRGIEDDSRPFIGRAAIRRELAQRSSRWLTVGLLLDWQVWDDLHTEAGLIPPKDATPLPYESMLYAVPEDTRNGAERVGFATSLMYSPVLQRHIAIARVRPDLATPGTTVAVEVTVDHEFRTVPAQVAALPLFDPPRRTDAFE